MHNDGEPPARTECVPAGAGAKKKPHESACYHTTFRDDLGGRFVHCPRPCVTPEGRVTRCTQCNKPACAIHRTGNTCVDCAEQNADYVDWG